MLKRKSGSTVTVFLDTEFTGLDWRYPRRLISVGLVASKESLDAWYAEVDGWSEEDCTPWVQAHVLPLLTEPRMTRKAAAKSLPVWLARLGSVQIASDSPNDWDLLGYTLPRNVAPERLDLAPRLQQADHRNALTNYWELHGGQHNALSDARAHRHASALIEQVPRQDPSD
ncbi:MAG: hypothetical protein J0H59_08055 [Comamonadaceae bacterium]|nr:hypothetical protein [Comamonadaceae bacterium]